MGTANVCFIGFGGNTDNPLARFQKALGLIQSSIGALINQSPCYSTKPLNPPELQDTSQPDFINMVAAVKSELSPEQTMQQLLDIERLLGRNRNLELRWGPRKIDLDLLMYDDKVVNSDFLTLPHPRMLERDFVLKPLCDIAPDTIHPTSNSTIQELLNTLYELQAPTYVLKCLDRSEQLDKR